MPLHLQVGPCCINQESCGFHLRQKLRINKALVLIGEWAMQAHSVGLTKQRFAINKFCIRFFPSSPCVYKNLHTKGSAKSATACPIAP